MNSIISFNSLPDELRVQIASYLPFKDCEAFRQTAKAQLDIPEKLDKFMSAMFHEMPERSLFNRIALILHPAGSGFSILEIAMKHLIVQRCHLPNGFFGPDAQDVLDENRFFLKLQKCSYGDLNRIDSAISLLKTKELCQFFDALVEAGHVSRNLPFLQTPLPPLDWSENSTALVVTRAAAIREWMSGNRETLSAIRHLGFNPLEDLVPCPPEIVMLTGLRAEDVSNVVFQTLLFTRNYDTVCSVISSDLFRVVSMEDLEELFSHAACEKQRHILRLITESDRFREISPERRKLTFKIAAASGDSSTVRVLLESGSFHQIAATFLETVRERHAIEIKEDDSDTISEGSLSADSDQAELEEFIGEVQYEPAVIEEILLIVQEQSFKRPRHD